MPDREIADQVREYVANATGGDPGVMVHMTTFRVLPWEQDACRRLPSAAEKKSYKRWVRRFTSALDDTQDAVVLQPDGRFALCAPRLRVLSELVAYAARRLGALPRTSVYIDAGSAGWNHHDPATPCGSWSAEASSTFAATCPRGARHFGPALHRRHGGERAPLHLAVLAGPPAGRDLQQRETCETRTDRRCVTLDIPPTTRVAAKRWGFPDQDHRLARRHVDGYLWAGGPWLVNQTSPFSMSRALDVARTTPC